MVCNLLISSSLLSDNDIVNLNHGEVEIRFSKTKSNNFLPDSTLILVLIETFGHNAVYDTVKYALQKLISVVRKKNLPTGSRMEIACNGKKCSIKFSCELSEEQKIKLLETTARILSEQ